MLLNVKYGFYKGCDQYLFELLLGPFQIFLVEQRLWPRSHKNFFFRDTREEMLEKLRLRCMIIIIVFRDTRKNFGSRPFFYIELNFGVGSRTISLPRGPDFLSTALFDGRCCWIILRG